MPLVIFFFRNLASVGLANNLDFTHVPRVGVSGWAVRSKVGEQMRLALKEIDPLLVIVSLGNEQFGLVSVPLT